MQNKHFLKLLDFTPEEIRYLINLSSTLKKAKQEADKGEFISHEAMGAWIKSLGTDEELPAPEVDIFKKPV